jgi:hypothetical protein
MQYHLVYLRIAVPPCYKYRSLIAVDRLSEIRGSVASRDVIPGAVIKDISGMKYCICVIEERDSRSPGRKTSMGIRKHSEHFAPDITGRHVNTSFTGKILVDIILSYYIISGLGKTQKQE